MHGQKIIAADDGNAQIARLEERLASLERAEAETREQLQVTRLQLGVASALVALTLANVQHRRALEALRSECPGLPRSTAGITAWVIMALGIVAFVTALL